MNTKVCTIGGECITCIGHPPREVKDAIEETEKAGGTFWCCSEKCVRIEHITTITEARSDEVDDLEGGDDLDDSKRDKEHAAP